MVGIEGRYRSQNKEATFDAGQQGGRSHEKEQPEIHYGGTPVAKPEFENGTPMSVTHLHMDRRGGQLRWWTERESLAEWGKRVESAHEQGDRRYRSAAADHIPSVVAHTYDDGRLRDAIGIYYSYENFPGLTGQAAKGGYVNHLNQRFAEEISGGYQGRQGRDDKSRPREEPPLPDEERGTFYEDVGLSASEFKARVAEARELLRTERQRYGQGFNEADFLHERIDQGIRHLVDRDLDKWDDELIASYEDLANGWDVMAFDRYSPQMQSRELEENGYNLGLFRRQGGVLVRKKAAAMLDIMATAIDLPHTLAQQIDPRDPRQKTYGQAGFDSEESLKRNYLIKVAAIKK